MLDEKRSLERQRLAWGVLVVSFGVFVIICISIPFIVNASVQNSTRLLAAFVQANQGTIAIDDLAGGRRAVIAGDQGQIMNPGEHVLTGNTDTALVTLAPPESQEVVAAFQVYSNTDFELVEATTPRFELSNHERRVAVRLDNGRLRITMPETEERPATILVTTPQGNVFIDVPGNYAVVVTTEDTQLTVREGVAQIEGSGQTLALQSGARARIPTGSAPVGPLGTERNLVANGNFTNGTHEWITNPWIVDMAAQPEGQIRPLTIGGEPRLNIARAGVGHAEVSIRQAINQDVSELSSLRFLLAFRILQSSLGVCGVKGSECPIFVRINYVDEGGASNTWQQGFYATGVVDENETPDSCITCAMVQGPHIRVPLQQNYFYEINDFREELALHGRLPPRYVESISLVFSGHSFEVEVSDLALLAEE